VLFKKRFKLLRTSRVVPRRSRQMRKTFLGHLVNMWQFDWQLLERHWDDLLFTEYPINSN